MAGVTKDEYVEWPFMENPKYKPFWFEIYDPNRSRKWLWENWTISIWASAVYLALVFLGQIWMKNRPPFGLRKVLAVWNFSLAAFSIFGFIRTGPDLWDVLVGENGFHRSVCVRDSLNPPTAFWSWLFVLSKIVELGDTGFIVLRKTPLIFLHWYHHITVLIFSWHCYPEAEPIFRWVGVMNYLVHSIMYSYYGLKALQFKIPRQFSMMITLLQLSQMALGLVVNLYAMYAKHIQGLDCARSTKGFAILMTIYGSYLILFWKFFMKTYFRGATKVVVPKKDATKNGATKKDAKRKVK